MPEIKPVRDFKFTKTWQENEFDVQWLGRPIGTVWKRRGGWVYKRANRSKWSTKPLHNRIAAARALADEPLAEPATRYPSKKRKRSRRKPLAASLLDTRGSRFWDLIDENLVD